MNNFKIFVEGVADTTFIRQYIAFIEGINTNEISKDNIIQCNGRTNLWAQEVINQLNQAIESDIRPLIIFDADISIEETQSEIKQKLIEKDIQPDLYDLFLFPNNHDPGDLETLLERIIPEQNKPILECWNRYEQCLETFATPLVRPGSLPPLTSPARKTKIYGYLEVLLGDSRTEKEKIKEPNREYYNKEYWDLNSPSLLSLKEFLLSHL